MNNKTFSIVQKTIFYFLFGAITLTVALGWNEAFKALLDYWFPKKKNSVISKFIYALFLTMLAVILALVYTKFVGSKTQSIQQVLENNNA